MDSFLKALMWLLDLFVTISIGFLIARSYFMVNKIWKRKHERVVSESISVFAELIGVTSAGLLCLKALLESQFLFAVERSIEIGLSSFFLLIGVGYWVASKNKPKSLWGLFKKALKLEKDEAGDLFTAFVRPVGADKVLALLHELAMVDQKLDPKEEAFIRKFAESWHLVYIPQAMGSAGDRYQSYERLRKLVADYLTLSPPNDQVSQLCDILDLLIKADADVTEEERLAHEEIRNQLAHYVDEDSLGERFKVVIAPQSAGQAANVSQLLPGTRPQPLLGGHGVIVGEYHSRSFARMVADRYRKHRLFTTVEVEKLPPPLPSVPA